MVRDNERVERVQGALDAAALDAVICALPSNVLLLTGYWPVVGDAIAIATRDGVVATLAPADEREIAGHGWSDELWVFEWGGLAALPSLVDAVRRPLGELLHHLRLDRARIGIEHGPASQPVTYAAMTEYGAALPALLREWVPAAHLAPADDLLARLRAVKTPHEIERIRAACSIAGRAFALGADALEPGMRETEVAAQFRAPLSWIGTGFGNVERADGFAWCMSGPDAALAGAAYARSRARRIEPDDLVLVHCNSWADGYWTDITRTFVAGEPDDRQRALYDVVLDAREAVLEVLAPGMRAADADAAAREVLRDRGLAERFPHGTGHGVGFAAIEHLALPRLHPASTDVLERGMVFNVEPAVYLPDYGAIRHCDVVALGADGAEVLTPFQSEPDALVRPRAGRR